MARKPNPLKRKLRQFKLEYIDSKQTEGGYCAEGKMALLAELKKTPEAWNLSDVAIDALMAAWDSVWHEDDAPGAPTMANSTNCSRSAANQSSARSLLPTPTCRAACARSVIAG